MRIIAIADTHNRHKEIELPLGDMIIHAGDATGSGTTHEVFAFLEWFGALPYKYKILVAGNHDVLFEENAPLMKQSCLDRNIIYLDDDGGTIGGIKIWGSPVQPWFCNWAFNRGRTPEHAKMHQTQHIKKHWDLIPEDTNILITHGPPAGILDQLYHVDIVTGSRSVGCNDLLSTVRKIKPDLHIFGHIHCCYGEKHVGGTSFYNVSVCDEIYNPTQPVTVIDYEVE